MKDSEEKEQNEDDGREKEDNEKELEEDVWLFKESAKIRYL